VKAGFALYGCGFFDLGSMSAIAVLAKSIQLNLGERLQDPVSCLP
jgi:hypothetical protein